MINYKAYSDMLSLQTQICWPFEYNFYFDIINDQSIISEVGCGNSEYLNTLSLKFPNAIYFGYDINSKLINYGKINNNQVLSSYGTINDINDNTNILLLRLIMHQIQNRTEFLNIISAKLAPNSKVIIIDPLDDLFILTPNLPKFNKRLLNVRSQLSPNVSGRQINQSIEKEMVQLGFKLQKKMAYFAPSTLPGYKSIYSEYMIATGKIIGKLDSDISQEILDWKCNPNAYVQIGLFMSMFSN